MQLLEKYGVRIPMGGPATTPEEAVKVAEGLNTIDLVIKAQVLAGGRGKGKFESGLQGGVKLISSYFAYFPLFELILPDLNRPMEAKMYAEKMLGKKLVTKQTGSHGKPCNIVLLPLPTLPPLISMNRFIFVKENLFDMNIILPF